jgi:hypothetical protein
MWHPLSAKVGTNFADKRWLLGRAQATEFSLLVFTDTFRRHVFTYFCNTNFDNEAQRNLMSYICIYNYFVYRSSLWKIRLNEGKGLAEIFPHLWSSSESQLHFGNNDTRLTANIQFFVSFCHCVYPDVKLSCASTHEEPFLGGQGASRRCLHFHPYYAVVPTLSSLRQSKGDEISLCQNTLPFSSQSTYVSSFESHKSCYPLWNLSSFHPCKSKSGSFKTQEMPVKYGTFVEFRIEETGQKLNAQKKQTAPFPTNWQVSWHFLEFHDTTLSAYC